MRAVLSAEYHVSRGILPLSNRITAGGTVNAARFFLRKSIGIYVYTQYIGVVTAGRIKINLVKCRYSDLSVFYKASCRLQFYTGNYLFFVESGFPEFKRRSDKRVFGNTRQQFFLLRSQLRRVDNLHDNRAPGRKNHFRARTDF